MSSKLELESDDLSPLIIRGQNRTNDGYHSSSIQTDLDGALDMAKNCYYSKKLGERFFFDNTKPAAIWELDSQGDACYYFSPAQAGAPTVAPAYLRIRGANTFGPAKSVQIENSQGGGDLILGTSQTDNTVAEGMRITSTQKVVVKNWLGLGTTPYSKLNLHNNSGMNDTFTLSGADVGHPFISLCDRRIAARFGMAWGANGGVYLQGFTDADLSAVSLSGHIGSTSPTSAAVVISGYKSSGTGRVALSGSEIVLSVNAGDSTRLVTVTADGKVNIGGASLYVENGALKFKGGSGTVTTIAQA